MRKHIINWGKNTELPSTRTTLVVPQPPTASTRPCLRGTFLQSAVKWKFILCPSPAVCVCVCASWLFVLAAPINLPIQFTKEGLIYYRSTSSTHPSHDFNVLFLPAENKFHYSCLIASMEIGKVSSFLRLVFSSCLPEKKMLWIYFRVCTSNVFVHFVRECCTVADWRLTLLVHSGEWIVPWKEQSCKIQEKGKNFSDRLDTHSTVRANVWHFVGDKWCSDFSLVTSDRQCFSGDFLEFVWGW